jgi:hypothetical protein
VPSQFISFAQSLVSVVLFVSNIFFWYQGEAYFAVDAELQPLLHTWSLAVEEQYYLLFPVFLLLLWRFGRQPVFWSVVAIAAISLVMAEWGSRNAPSASFYLAPTRAWELLAGSICAFLAVDRPQRSSNVLSALGLALIVFAILQFDADTPFPSLYTLVPVVGTALIILFAARETWVARLLSTRAFVGIGLISYSAYLWHQPIFAFARLRSPTEPDGLLIGALSVASLLLAWATWHYVEQPFRRRPVPVLPSRRGVFAWSGAVGALIGAIGVTGHLGGGFAWRFTTPTAMQSGMFDMPHLEKGFCFYSINDNRTLSVGEEGLDCFLTTDGDAKVLLFGDSHAAQWEPFWQKVARAHEFVLHSVNTNWCFPAFSDAFKGPVTSRAREHCFFIREWLRENHDAYDVIILAGGWEAVTTQRDQDSVREVFDEILGNGTARIVVMPHPIPVRQTNVERAVFGLDDTLEIDQKALTRIQAVEGMLVRHYADDDRVIFLDRENVFGDYFSSAGLLTADGLPYSFDGGHISIYGSLAAWDSFVSRMDDQAFVEQLLKN